MLIYYYFIRSFCMSIKWWSYCFSSPKLYVFSTLVVVIDHMICIFTEFSLSSPSPAHDTGLVTLQVAVSNQIISNSVVFEYKARALPSLPSSQHDWLSLDGMSLLSSTLALVASSLP